MFISNSKDSSDLLQSSLAKPADLADYLALGSMNSERAQDTFLTCFWRFLISNKLEQFKFKLEKLLGFRNMQEKLENIVHLFFFFFLSELVRIFFRCFKVDE